jgi:general secretion pathway protein E
MGFFDRNPLLVNIGQQVQIDGPQEAKVVKQPAKEVPQVPHLAAVTAETPAQVASRVMPTQAPVTAPSRVQVEEDENPIIERLDQVPDANKVLTGIDTGSLIPIPKTLEYSLVVIETKPKVARIYYDPEADARQIGQEIRQIRIKLQSNSYHADGREQRCRSSVLRSLVDDFKAKNSADELGGLASNSYGRKTFENIVDIAVKERATDIHFQFIRNKAEVKIRVDGELEPLCDENGGVYMSSQMESAVGWAYTNGTADDSNSHSQFSSTANLYAMIKPRHTHGKMISLRYQTLVGEHGPKVVCRILNTDTNQPTLSYEQLGYYPSHIEIFREAARTPAGMVLFAGVTGSGKSTSQKTFIETHPGNGSSAFYSIEDPIEYPLKGVHQIPMQRDLLNREKSNAMYAEIVSGLMRSDPDCVMVGEVRDRATASASQQIVETGHMALGTVHAHLLSGIIPRLTDEEVGMSRKLLTSPNIINMLNYQALIPKLCENCMINGCDHAEHEFINGGGITDPIIIKKDIEYVLSTLEKQFGMDRKNFNFRRTGGCPSCNQRGTAGLTVAAEMMIPTRKWLQLTRDGEDYKAIEEYRAHSDKRWDSDNMNGKTVFEHTLHKALMGYVDPRQCERFDSLARFDLMDTPKLT